MVSLKSKLLLARLVPAGSYSKGLSLQGAGFCAAYGACEIIKYDSNDAKLVT